ncbi:hypothetical protein BGZ51_004935 [Haplosporangium sp. Z 767]|nr:hypothetical protein BGZ51_004935 [Haplosporangium sp. Z 767]
MTLLKVVIVGADVGTLTLALILEQAGIDYILLESQESVPVVAGGIILHPTILPLLEQLSLRDDLLFNSQPIEQVMILDADMEHISSFDWSARQTRYSAWSRFMSRPEYCEMLIERLPESKILFNKSVVSVKTVDHDDGDSNNNSCTAHDDVFLSPREESGLACDPMAEKGEARGVTVECADGSFYTAHIIIGDVNSKVEQKLVNSNNNNTASGHHADEGKEGPIREVQYHISGITETLDPQRIPLLKEDTTELRLVLDDKNSLSWWAATLVDHRIAWQVTKRISLSEKSSRVADIGSIRSEPDAATLMSQISSTMMCPLGGTMEQLILWTTNISCKRWDDSRTSPQPNSCRVQILGEACRKVLPVLGQAVDESILDALAMSEALFSLPSTRLNDIQSAFTSYHRERALRRESAIEESRQLDTLLHAKGIVRKTYRSLVLNYTPKYIQEKKSDEKYSYRPQASFLQRTPDYGLLVATSH